MAHILIADDNRGIADMLAEALAELRFTPDVAYTARDAEAKLRVNTYDLAIIDRTFEGEEVDGIALLQTVRHRQCSTPVLMLTGQGALIDRVTGLTAGADDYLTKPFHLPELIARVHALLRRRATPTREAILAGGGITLDRDTFDVRADGIAITLSVREFQLLRHLMEQRGSVVARHTLLEQVWGDTDMRFLSNTVDVHIGRLRKKLGSHRDVIQSVPGIGYRFAAPLAAG